MTSVCFYFQVHQPFRIRRYSVFDRDPFYFDNEANREICEKVADKCYRPATRLLLDLVRRHEGRFRISFAVTGVALEQFEMWAPDVLEMFQELIAIRGIAVVKEYGEPDQTLIMDEGLSDILVTNLLKNAILHNLDGGRIFIITGRDYLELRNDGPPLSMDEDKLFDRFTRDTGKKGNFGLGLSIVKKICEYYGFRISYSRLEGLHRFRISFSNNSS